MIGKSEQERLKSRIYEAKVPGMVRAHLQRIRQAHDLGGIGLIFNPLPDKRQKKEYGYIGRNTTLEIGAMEYANMVVLFMRPHQDPSIREVSMLPDKSRTFSAAYPTADPLDYDKVWDVWLKGWLNGS